MVNYADEIKRSVPMREVAAMYGFEADRTGNIRCPFHNDKNPSMHIYDGTRGYWCFVCNEGGDVIDFTRRYFNLSFMDACKKLNADFNLHLPLGEKLTLAQMREADRKAAQRKREQIEREMAQKHVLTAYHAALDRWVSLDIMKRENAPKSTEEPFSEEYAYACKHIDAAAYELDRATDALRAFESQS